MWEEKIQGTETRCTGPENMESEVLEGKYIKNVLEKGGKSGNGTDRRGRERE